MLKKVFLVWEYIRLIKISIHDQLSNFPKGDFMENNDERVECPFCGGDFEDEILDSGFCVYCHGTGKISKEDLYPDLYVSDASFDFE